MVSLFYAIKFSRPARICMDHDSDSKYCFKPEGGGDVMQGQSTRMD